MNTPEFIKEQKFIAILRHIPASDAKEVAKALYDGGIRIFEITFNPSDKNTISNTSKLIEAIYSLYGDEVCVGAGTVIKKSFAKAAYNAGAKFIVSPCTDKKVIKYTKKKGMVSIPGAYTPTEIMNAYNMGADIVKIFPIGPDDEEYLKNVISPLSHIPFMITGGINPDTITKFLSTGATAVAAGATIVTKELVENKNFEQITLNAKKHLDKIR